MKKNRVKGKAALKTTAGSPSRAQVVKPRSGKGRTFWTRKKLLIMLGVLGFLVGGAIAFFYRPSVPRVGQLSLMDVLTRGATLDKATPEILGVARSSFNGLLWWGALGALAALLVGNFCIGRDGSFTLPPLLQYYRTSTNFASEAWQELRKVIWPSRKETMGATLVVVVLVLIVAVFLMLVDLVLSWTVGRVIR